MSVALSRRTGRARRAVATAAWLLCAGTVGVTSASGAPMGAGTSGNLSAFSFATTTGAPTVVAYENFTGTNGTNLNGTTTDGGGFTWAANLGTWTIQGNQARSTSINNGNILFNGSSNNGSVEATISRNGATTWDTYVIINSDSSFTETLLANWWSNANGSIDLFKGVSGVGYTQLASVTGLYPGGPGTAPASVVVRLESPASSVIKVYLDGVLKITYTLTAGEQTTYKNATHRHAGFGANSDATSTFDKFHLDA